MTQSTINLNQVPTEPSLSDLLSLLQKRIALSFNVHHLGTIQSFDASTQTATITINYKKTFFSFNAESQTYLPVLQDYPLLIDVPVIILSGALGRLTFPIARGDQCVLLCNDRDLDNWFAGLANGALATPRTHSLADAMALVGVRSSNTKLTDYDASNVVLKNDAAKVLLTTTLIEISNNTYNLNTILQSLITAIEALVTATAGITVSSAISVPSTPFSGSSISGAPLNAAAIAAINATLATLATQLGGLLR